MVIVVPPPISFRANQFQALLDETDFFFKKNPFQSNLRPDYGIETALVTLCDDLCQEKDRGSVALMVILDFSAAFSTINHSMFLDTVRVGI